MPLSGEFTILREERLEDQPSLMALRNNLDTQAWSKTLPPDYTLPMYEKRFAAREFSYNPLEGRFIIEDRTTRAFIGTVSYTGLESRWAATIGVMVERSYWGTPHTRDAQEVLLKFLFEELGLRVVRLWTHSGNVRAIGSAQKLGFVLSGRQREAIFKGGQFFDNVVMDMLREEYYALHPALSDHMPPLGAAEAP